MKPPLSHFVPMSRITSISLALAITAMSTIQAQNLTPIQAQQFTPPDVRQKPHITVIHGDTLNDPYSWLNQRENPEVLDYLRAENEYADSQLAHTKDLQAMLFEEMKGRIKEDDRDVPYFSKGYWYYSRVQKGQDYSLYCRRKESMEAPEEIMLDANRYAEGHGFFSVTGLKVSPDNRYLMFFMDTVGRRQYTLCVKDLGTGTDLPDKVFPANGSAAWSADNRTIFFGTSDARTLRADCIWRHRLGQDPNLKELIYRESDETFSTYVFAGKSEEFVYISSSSTLSSEQRYLPSDQPEQAFTVITPRHKDLLYTVEDYNKEFYILTNHQALNFRLMKSAVGPSKPDQWIEVIPHRPKVRLQGIEIFRDFLVLEEREAGLKRLRVRRWDGTDDHYLAFADPAYTVSTEVNRDYNSSELRYSYSSLTTPTRIVAYDMIQRSGLVLKTQQVVGGHQPSDYRSERILVKASDGTEVPVSLVYKKALRRSGGNPTLLYGYGSYGISTDAYFSMNRLSLLDRGWVFAIAHIRGGEEMGRAWYEAGKLLNKKNSFTDFIVCGEAMLSNGYCEPGQLYAMGGSAGGLLMGAVMNMRPDLWKGVIAGVPFVDVINTMLDASIPLTTSEYDEWGNPMDETSYRYIFSYSPYDNVNSVVYPNLLVTTGLHDSQVQYWEPAKWVAKLRDAQEQAVAQGLPAGERRIYLVTDMEAGHGGKSGRYNALKDDALEFAFLLDLAGQR
jgi:oligopeptidase B